MDNQFEYGEFQKIFQKLTSGKVIPITEPSFQIINQECSLTLKLVAEMNASGDISLAREILSKITNSQIDESTTLFPPFTINFGKFTRIGKHVFINHGCSFLDLGGITIEDHVLIGPQVKLVTENHPINPTERRGMMASSILIQENAWIGAGATILPGVTIGKNSVVAAGAVVSKDVPENTVVGGIPAKPLKNISH